MAIETTVEIKAVFFRRWLTVKQLKEILLQLEDDDIVAPNRVGNLSVFRDSKREMIGYIDFQEERLETV